jgi:hypothetical protein
MTKLPDLRKRVAALQIGVREAREDLVLVKAQGESRAIEAAGGEKQLGANAEARERALLIALAADEDYQRLTNVLRALERGATQLEAELEGERDIRREIEWGIRARLAAALDGRGIHPENGHGEIADDQPEADFEAAADAEAGDRLVAELRDEMEAKGIESELDPASLPF